jgi:branched-chain amino acid aminotransferase
MIEKLDKIWMDGDLVGWDEARVHVLTHTLHYGLGVFEGIRCYQCHDGSSAIFRLVDHIDRLFDSAHIAGITIPYSKEEICEACEPTVCQKATFDQSSLSVKGSWEFTPVTTPYGSAL